MKIVIEYVLIENFLINLIILSTVSLFLKEQGRLFFLSAFLGAGVTLLCPLLNLTTLGSFLLQLGFAVFYICISFKFSSLKKFCMLYFAYFVSAFLYGGACFFFEGLISQQSLLVVLMVVTMVYIVVRVFCSRREKKKNLEGFCFDIKIVIGGLEYSFKAFLDSGNFLSDPITGKPVCLINFKAFSTLFSEIGIEDILRKNDKVKKLKFAHYINFNTLNAHDKILVFQVDEMKIGAKSFERPTLGLSLKNFNQTFGTDVILHNEFSKI